MLDPGHDLMPDGEWYWELAAEAADDAGVPAPVLPSDELAAHPAADQPVPNWPNYCEPVPRPGGLDHTAPISRNLTEAGAALAADLELEAG